MEWILVGCQLLVLCANYPQVVADGRSVKSPLADVLNLVRNRTKEERNLSTSFEENVFHQSLLSHLNGTDSGLYNGYLFEGDILTQENGMRNAISNRSKLWPNGVVIFKISNDVGCPKSQQCKILMYAMEIYHRNTCLRFREWTGETDYVEIFYNKRDSGACWSAVGRSGGLQRVSLGYRCWYVGIAVHELGHAVGFWHEMNRPERDNYIRIRWENILPGFASAFTKNSPSTLDTLGEPFDLSSIMMYDEYAFSKDGRSPTIETKSGARIGPIWQKTGLSPSDIRRIHKLYKCQGNKTKSGISHRFSCDFSSHTCGFKNRDRNVWKWRKFPKSDGYMFAAGNRSSSNAQLISINFHPLEETSSKHFSGCITLKYFMTKDVSLQVKQESLFSATDLGQGYSKKLWNSTNPTPDWEIVKINVNLRKAYRVVIVPIFSDMGIAAVNTINIIPSTCST